MGDVDVIARLAKWKFAETEWKFAKTETDAAATYKKSNSFKINGWEWFLTVFKLPRPCIRLSLKPAYFTKNQLPFVRFVVRVTGANPKPFTYSKMHESVAHISGAWLCCIDRIWQSPFIISVQFLEISLPNGGVVGSSILPSFDKQQHLATRSSSRSLSHMLDDSVHADITIATSDGKLRAHKAVLSTSSPVFRGMFTHDFKEKISSTVEIMDMTSESCMALLRFLYGSVKQQEFWKHRLVLLGAAHKYDITDLKDACEESLLEDIDVDNVFDRLQEAWLYEAGKLKRGCYRYLLDFDMIHHVSREEMHDFLKKNDRELAIEMFDKMLEARVAQLGPDDPYVTRAKRLKVSNTE